MKQGSVRESSPRKTEPMPRSVSPGAVSDIGVHQVRTMPKPMYDGRGFKAPSVKSHNNNSGSQGTY
jgi:hypothetical protein